MKQLAYFFSSILSLYPSSGDFIGRKFNRARSKLLVLAGAKIGKQSNIGRYCRFSQIKQIQIDEQSGIGDYCYICGPVKIGSYCMIAEQTMILTQNHAYNDLDKPIGDQGNQEPREVVIGDDVWIGTRVMVLPGVKIGNGSVIGAGAVLRRDIPENSVVIGNPAQVIKKRGQKSNNAKRKSSKVLG